MYVHTSEKGTGRIYTSFTKKMFTLTHYTIMITKRLTERFDLRMKNNQGLEEMAIIPADGLSDLTRWPQNPSLFIFEKE